MHFLRCVLGASALFILVRSSDQTRLGSHKTLHRVPEAEDFSYMFLTFMLLLDCLWLAHRATVNRPLTALQRTPA
jgi:hypothetical protein